MVEKVEVMVATQRGDAPHLQALGWHARCQ
jgi:hypothetical protein